MRRISKLSFLLAPLFLASLTGCVTSGRMASSNGGIGPGRVDRLLTIAAEYENSGRPGAALGVYEHVLARQPDNAIAKERMQILAKSGVQPSKDPKNGLRQNLNPASPETMIANAASKDGPTATDLSRQISQKNAALAEQMAKTKPIRSPEVQAESSSPELPPLQADVKLAMSGASEARPAHPLPNIETASSTTDDTSWTATKSDVVSAAQSSPEEKSVAVNEPESKTEVISQSAGVEPAKTTVAQESSAWSTTDLTRHEIPELAPAPVDIDWEKSRLVTLCENLPASLIPLVEQLEDKDPLVRVQALQRLSEQGTEAAGAKVAVYSLLEDSEAIVAVYAASTLRDISDDAWSSVRTLSAYLSNKDVQIVRLSAYLLGRFGPEAMDSMSALESVRDSSDLLTSLHAAEALTHIAPDDRVSFERLKSALSSNDTSVRWFAAVSMGAISGDCEPAAATALQTALSDVDPQVRAAACLSLGGLGNHAAIAIPELEEAAKSDSAEVKDAASTALACLRG